jgi:enoyl-[acyl-carrier protein] reductase I
MRASTPDTAANGRILPVLPSAAFNRQEGSGTVSEGILEGKTALVAGVANKRSIAWAIAQALHGAGASLTFTYQGERLEESVRKLAAEVGSDVVVPCDVSDDASIAQAFDRIGQATGGLDIMAHSIAYAPAESFENRFVETSRSAFATALDISAYSMIAMAKHAEPLMAPRGGGAMVTLTYMASERAFPKYNVMAVAKAALECSVRYLAYELGPAQIRVNAISAGPVRTLAAKGIPGFDQMESVIEERSPLKKNIAAADVGSAALFLCSPMGSMVTGTTLYVDSGYHAMGM